MHWGWEVRRVEKWQKLLLLAVQSQSSTFVGPGPWFYWFIQVEPDPGPTPHHPNAKSLTGGPVCPCDRSTGTTSARGRLPLGEMSSPETKPLVKRRFRRREIEHTERFMKVVCTRPLISLFALGTFLFICPFIYSSHIFWPCSVLGTVNNIMNIFLPQGFIYWGRWTKKETAHLDLLGPKMLWN